MIGQCTFWLCDQSSLFIHVICLGLTKYGFIECRICYWSIKYHQSFSLTGLFHRCAKKPRTSVTYVTARDLDGTLLRKKSRQIELYGWSENLNNGLQSSLLSSKHHWSCLNIDLEQFEGMQIKDLYGSQRKKRKISDYFTFSLTFYLVFLQPWSLVCWVEAFSTLSILLDIQWSLIADAHPCARHFSLYFSPGSLAERDRSSFFFHQNCFQSST